MKLIHLAAGLKCKVLAVCERDQSQVLAFLMQGLEDQPKLTEMMTALILQEVPNDGLPWEDPRKVRQLYKDILWEFKRDLWLDGEHAGMRIVFFLDSDEPERVVCASGFYKMGNAKTPDSEKDKALKLRQAYFDALASGLLEIESLGEDSHESVN